MRNIKLYGHLGKQFGKLHRMDVNSAAEAVSALRANFPGFERAIMAHNQPGYHVVIGRKDLGADQLSERLHKGDIKIIPVVQGAKRGGVLQTVIGFMLIVSTFIPGSPTIGNSAVQAAGMSMMASGVIQLLTRVPKRDNSERPENRPSYGFNGPVNTTTQGNPVPICYGEMMVGSQVASFGMSVESTFVSLPAPGSGGGTTDGLPVSGSAPITVGSIETTGRPSSWDYNGLYHFTLRPANTPRTFTNNYKYNLRFANGLFVEDAYYDSYAGGFIIDGNSYPAMKNVTVGMAVTVERSETNGPDWDSKPGNPPITDLA